MRVADLTADGRLSARPDRPAHPLVSVLMPVYRRNASGFLDNAIRSVLAQTCADFELIAVDDGSRDGTYDTCLRCQQADPRVIVIRHERNSGLPAVREYQAYRESRGRYVAFMFEDDEWTENALETLLAPLDGRADDAVAHGWVHAGPRRAPGGVIGRHFTTVSNLRSHNFLANHAVLVPRALLDDVGLFDPHLVMRRLCDWDLLIRLERAADFIHVDALVGYTGGATLTDSLGRSQTLDHGLVATWMSRNRNAALRPDAFERYEVDADHVQGARLAAHEHERLRALVARHRHVHGEYWAETADAGTAADATVDAASASVPRILVVSSSSLSASTDLCFWNPLRGRVDVVLTTVIARAWPPATVIDYDAVVISRVLAPDTELWIRAARTSGVSLYFFIDDNLFEMAAAGGATATRRADTPYVQRLLAEFDGILTSSTRLMEEMRQTFPGVRTHHLIPPGYAVDRIPDAWNGLRDDTWDIVYFGSGHRTAEFELMHDVLTRLGREHRVRFTSYGMPDTFFSAPPGVNVEFHPHDVNYNAALRRATRARHAVAIGPLFPRAGTRSKTLCKLGDATTIGAVIALSDVEPYVDLRGRDVCELCDNTVDGWVNAIQRLFEDPDRTARMFRNARALVAGELNAQTIGDDLVALFGREVRKRLANDRLAAARAFALDMAASPNAATAFGALPDDHPIDPNVPLRFVPVHRAPRRYWLRASRRGWSGVSVIVSTTELVTVTGRMGYVLRDRRGTSLHAGEVSFATMSGGVWIDLTWPAIDVTTPTPFVLELSMLDGDACGVIESPPSARHNRWMYRWLGWSRPVHTLVRHVRYDA